MADPGAPPLPASLPLFWGNLSPQILRFQVPVSLGLLMGGTLLLAVVNHKG